MEMRMKKQVLSPTVKYSEKADLGAQMLGIGSDGGQGLGRGAEENAVDEIFVLVSDGSNLFGNREDDMKIMSLENFGRSIRPPLEGLGRLRLGLHRDRARQQIKRARCRAHFAGRDAEIF